MADFQAAVADDDAFGNELQDRLLVIENRRVQPRAGAITECLQVGANSLCLDPFAGAARRSPAAVVRGAAARR